MPRQPMQRAATPITPSVDHAVPQDRTSPQVSRWGRFVARLSRPVSGDSLGVFRIGFGLLMAYEGLYYLGLIPFAPGGAVAWRHLARFLGGGDGDEPIALNHIQSLYTGTHVHWNISFPGFGWVRPLGEPWTTLAFVALTLAALLVAAGWMYRPAVICLTILFGWVNLLELCVYLNHFYLAWLLCLLLCFMPADRRYSVAAWMGRAEATSQASSGLIPFWCVFLLRAQMMVVYFFAGVAKTNPDWLAGEPPRTWLHQVGAAPYLARYIGVEATQSVRRLLATEGATWLMTYGGLALDLSAPFLLVWRKTRPFAILAVVAFHGANFFLFNIGAFPVFALLTTTLFLEPDWPIRPRWWLWSFLLLGGPIGLIAIWLLRRGRVEAAAMPQPATRPLARLGLAAIGLWLLIQVLVPLRHFLIPGYVVWTEEGSLVSWHMMLRHKTTGAFVMEVVDRGLPLEVGRSGPRYVLPKSAAAPPQRVYRQVDATAVRWADFEELVLTYEPIVGERIIYNPLSSKSRGTMTARGLAASLEKVLGRNVQVLETYPLATVLESYRKEVEEQLRIEQLQGAVSLRRAQSLANLLVLQALAAKVAAGGGAAPQREEAIQTLQRHLQMQVQVERTSTGLAKWLKQAAPFAMQGAVADRCPWLAVYVAEILERPEPGAGVMFAIDRRHWGGYEGTLIDLRRLSDVQHRALPEVLSMLDFDGRPTLVWNWARDLHLLQIASVRSNPPALHRYANRVADLWHRRYGRRPEVHAESWVKLNARPLSPLVDAGVDLAGVPLRVFGHNPWILPPGPLPGGGVAQDRGLWTSWPR